MSRSDSDFVSSIPYTGGKYYFVLDLSCFSRGCWGLEKVWGLDRGGRGLCLPVIIANIRCISGLSSGMSISKSVCFKTASSEKNPRWSSRSSSSQSMNFTFSNPFYFRFHNDQPLKYD